MLDVIQSFNSQYLSYVYYGIAFAFLAALLFFFKELVPLLGNIKTTANSVRKIGNQLTKTTEKTTKIKNTIDNSLPLFTKAFFVLSLLHIIEKEYKKDRRKGKNIKLHQVAIKQATKPNNMAKLKAII